MPYKVVETCVVTDESIESILNQWTAAGVPVLEHPFRYHRVLTQTGYGFYFFHRDRGKRKTGVNVLIVKNIAAEGPGTIGDHLRSEGLPSTVIDLQKGDPLPDLGSFTHLVVMGGPMAVYEMHLHQHLKNEAVLIEQAIKAGKHVLGVCLGAQMIAHVLGARVYAGGKQEIGWYEVELSAAAMLDPAMAPLAMQGRQAADVFQWHGDTFELPAGAVRLASSSLYQNQAFRFSDRVYALQFHIEVTPSIVQGWLEHEKGIDLGAISAHSDRIYPAYRSRARGFYNAFFKP